MIKDIQTMIKDIGIEQIENVYNRFLSVRKEGLEAENNRKEIEKELREQMASAKQLYKKDNTPDIGKIKLPLVKEAMKVFLFEEPNKLEEKLETMEEYISDFKNDETLKEKAEQLGISMAEEKSIKEGSKEIKDEYTGVFDKDLLNALDDIAKETIKQIKDEEKSGETSTTDKDDLKHILKKYLNTNK